MYSVKRSSNCIENLSSETKKLRTTFPKENVFITCIEDLSNELFYEICEYLDGCDIYKAFSNLNFRFQHLITCSPLPLKIKFDSTSKLEIEHICKDVIIPNQHRILSLYFQSESIIDDFFTHRIIDSSFGRLESIVLDGVSFYRLLILFFYLKSLTRLVSLTIYIADQWGDNLGDIYRFIFSFPSLKYNRLGFNKDNDNYCGQVRAFVALASNERFSTIEYLNINHMCKFKDFVSILQHTPQLRHLFCANLSNWDTNIDFQKLVALPNLTYLRIGDCGIGFNEFEIFIKKLSAPLQILNIEHWVSQGCLDADRWERIIRQHIPHLCRFYYKVRGASFRDYRHRHLDFDINRFTSIFWIERQWFFEIMTDFNDVTYIIRPFRKSWFDSYESAKIATCFDQNPVRSLARTVAIPNRQDTFSSSNQLGPIIQLSIDGIHKYRNTYEQKYFLMDKFRSLFVPVQFTRLNIKCNNICSGTFLKIIQLLSNLDSLTVSSLPTIESGWLVEGDVENLYLTSINNKITKVSLQDMVNIKQVHFLLHLCLCIQYFQVNVPKNMDLEMLVRLISQKAGSYNPRLKSLYVCIPNANEAMVDQLQNLINTEKLLSSYKIKRICNDILLKWN